MSNINLCLYVFSLSSHFLWILKFYSPQENNCIHPHILNLTIKKQKKKKDKIFLWEANYTHHRQKVPRGHLLTPRERAQILRSNHGQYADPSWINKKKKQKKKEWELEDYLKLQSLFGFVFLESYFYTIPNEILYIKNALGNENENRSK